MGIVVVNLFFFNAIVSHGCFTEMQVVMNIAVLVLLCIVGSVLVNHFICWILLVSCVSCFIISKFYIHCKSNGLRFSKK